MEEIKKDIKHIQVSKNTIIAALSIALVFVSAIAIGLAVGEEGHWDRGEHGYNREDVMSGKYDDNNINPNDGETNNDRRGPVDQSVKLSPTTPVSTPVTPQTIQKQ